MKKYRMFLSDKSIQQVTDNLQKYKNNLIEDKGKKFCKALIQKGIYASQTAGGQYQPYLKFTCKLDSQTNDTITFIYTAEKTRDIKVVWKTGSALVDPLLMAEFGSGWLAINKWNLNGVGQGTFPDQKHAFDRNGWYWVDNNGNKYHSMGELPSLPVHKAWLAMCSSIDQTVKEIFN